MKPSNLSISTGSALSSPSSSPPTSPSQSAYFCPDCGSPTHFNLVCWSCRSCYSTSDFDSTSQIYDMDPVDDLFSPLDNSPQLDDAGIPYADFRSAARSRKIRYQKRGICNSYRCRKSHQAENRSENKRAKKEKLRFAVEVSQREEMYYKPGSFKPTKHTFLHWDTSLPEESDDYISAMDNDMIRYSYLHQNAAIFENPAPYTEFGETFSAWAQRRISEMRAVKESRLRGTSVIPRNLAVWKSSSWHYKKYKVYTGTPLTTTLPTTTDDAIGHALLHSIITPNKWWEAYRRKLGLPLFRPIEGFSWFDEFSWAWHRNESGCWEIGFDDCEQASIPCPCCCAGGGSMYFSCFCKEFGKEPAPEEAQMCALLEWVGEEGRRIILEEEERARKSEESRKYEITNDVDVSEMDSGWDIVSLGSSESDSWSMVDGEA